MKIHSHWPKTVAKKERKEMRQEKLSEIFSFSCQVIASLLHANLE